MRVTSLRGPGTGRLLGAGAALAAPEDGVTETS